MKQEQINRLEELKEEQRVEKINHRERMRSLNHEITQIYKKCDHVHPNGKKAYKGGFMYSHCEICYANDL